MLEDRGSEEGDNDSAGLSNFLSTSSSETPQAQPQPVFFFFQASKEVLVSDNANAFQRGFWSFWDAALCDRPQTQILSFPLKETKLRGLVEKTSYMATAEVFYYIVTRHYLYPQL